MQNYDVIVVGGGTAGCACAYTAGKLGMKTLLVEKNIHLGGAITSGLVIPAMNSSENQINTDFFNDFIEELQLLNAQITYSDGNRGWFNPELTKIALDRMMAKAGVEVRFNSAISNLEINDKKINSCIITSEMLSVSIAARFVVDATGNCEIFAMANCEFLESENNSGENYFQPVSMRFIMSGIDLKKFSTWLLDFDKDRNVTSACEAGGQIHLSTAYTWDGTWALAPLFEDAVAQGILKDEDRAYFQVFTVPNMPSALAFNCPRIHFDTEIDPLDPVQSSKALIKGREAIVRMADFCKIYFPGFEKSYISNIADELGIRVSRRIKGKYIYSVDDLRNGKKFENPVLISNYPIDVHSNKKENSTLEHQKQEYQLPIEALMSTDIDNLFAAGRGLSADFMAQGALRIQPSCFSMGEGVSKYIKEKLL